ncbi:MAG: hypothetical protein ACR2LU_08900, partial [Luteitalea sp.]
MSDGYYRGGRESGTRVDVATRRSFVLSAALAGLGLAAACSRVSAPGNSTAATSPTDTTAFVAQANATLLA